MSNLAKVENDVITHILDGDQADWPSRIDIDGKLWGIGWTTNDGGQTFNQPAFFQEYKTTFLPESFLAELSEDEFDLFDASNNVAVKKFLRRMEGRKAGMVSVTPKYVTDIGALLADGVLSQARHDVLVNGLPA